MSGIIYISGNLSTHPHCPHGPALLLSRVVNENGQRRRFFTCAACRDQELCSFFYWEDDYYQLARGKCPRGKKYLPSINHEQAYKKYLSMKEINQNARALCFTCHKWINIKQGKAHNKNHIIETGISDEYLLQPSKFLPALSNNKKEAQYFFSDKTVKVIMNILKSLNIQNVINIGAPRIHETVINFHPEMNSFLLDLDYRYHNFFSSNQYCCYNLFNHYFFHPDSEEIFMNFLKNDAGKGFILIIDPPFGGLTGPIADTYKKIKNVFYCFNKSNLPVLLFYPYFNEKHIKESFDFKMVDYKVDYENHNSYNNGEKGRKYGSAGRMFTNVPLNKIPLPKEEGYRFCDICDKWVYKENVHCLKCNACTSKDGRTYQHCNLCSKCVKPTWNHCTKCNRCCVADHTCEKKFKITCYQCFKVGHKKTECPELIKKVDNKKTKRIKTKR